MDSKKCFKCGEDKPLSEYYKHKGMKDGHLNKCKSCCKAEKTANRNDKLQHYQAYDRERGNRQTLEYQHRYREKNPKKRAAHVAVGNAVRDGKLIPQPCMMCGATEVHGHHVDYDKPLEVQWLCPKDHKWWHEEFGEGLNAR